MHWDCKRSGGRFKSLKADCTDYTSYELWAMSYELRVFKQWFSAQFFTVGSDLLRKLNEGSWINDIYASNSHKIKKIDAYVNRECWPFTRPRAWLFLSRPLNFGAACLISCSQRQVNQHILRWLLENVILHHQVKMEVRDGGVSSATAGRLIRGVLSY